MKQKIRVIGGIILVFLAGMAAMRVWDAHQRRTAASVPFVLGEEPMDADVLSELNLSEATEPDGVVALGEPGEPQLATESNLVPLQLKNVANIISRSGNTYTPDEKLPSVSRGVDLGDIQYNASTQAVAQAQAEAQAQAPAQEPPSGIVMIAAPVEPLLIKTAEEYKAFKRRARGSYPSANFAKDNVLVLESTSNLPDKVFEIQDVREQNGKMVVTYRVNMFGLNKKTNTHSAVLIKKRDLPLEFKQVI